MKEITKYEAQDGREFDTAEECLAYEYKLRILEDFVNGTDCCGFNTSHEDMLDFILENFEIIRKDAKGETNEN